MLPAFPGLNTHQRAIDAGCRFAGATVHQVTADLDHGPILAQAVVPVLPGDSADTLAARVLSQEHQLYSQVIGWIATDRLQWQNGMLEFEGLSDSPEDWHSLLNDMSLFDRWKTRPQILQTHSVASKAPQSGGSQVALKLKANLWTPSTNASNTFTTKSAP